MSKFTTKNLKFGYMEEEILKGINFEADSGKIYSIAGPNGSGKSTFLKNILKLLKYKSGEIEIDGENLTLVKGKRFAELFSYVPQEGGYCKEFTVYDSVMDGRYRHFTGFGSESEEDRKAVERAMKLADIMSLKNKKIGELSGGEKRRTLIARAIAQESRFLVMDEPFSNLDIHHQLEISEVIEKIKNDEKRGVIMVVHDLNSAMQHSDKVMMIKSGRVFAFGKPKEVLSAENIKEVYGIDILIADIKGYRNGYIIPVVK